MKTSFNADTELVPAWQIIFDFKRLDGIAEEGAAILGQSPFIDKNRRDILSAGIETRRDMLERIAFKQTQKQQRRHCDGYER